MEKLYWTGYCEQERQAAIRRMNELINRHGFVADFKMFSDLSLSLIIEIDEHKIDALYNDLSTYLTLSDFKYLGSVSSRARIILFNVSFTSGTGDLAIDVPAVPG